MANIQKYFQQTSYQKKVTEAPKPYSTPIVDALRNVTETGQQFYQRYRKAQYDRNKYDLVNKINSELNEWQQHRKTNPILPNSPEYGNKVYHSKDQDIISLKTMDWENQSKKIESIIDQTDDKDLKEDMKRWWQSQSMVMKDKVINQAIDENIAFMHSRAIEDVNTFISQGAYDSARARAVDAVKAGVLSRDQLDEINDNILYASVIDNAENVYNQVVDDPKLGDPIEAVKKVIEKSPLEADEKVRAEKYITQKLKLQEKEKEKVVNDYINKTSLSLYEQVWNGTLGTVNKLEYALNNIPDPEYMGRKINGVGAEIANKNKVSLYAVLNSRLKDSKKDGEEVIPPDILDDLEKIRMSGSRDDLLQALYKYQSQGRISYDTVSKYIADANKSQYSRLNDTYKNLIDKNVNDLVKEEIISQEEKGVVRKAWNDFVTSFNDKDRFLENYYQYVDDFFNNYKRKHVIYTIDKLDEDLREEGNFSKLTPSEKFLQDVEEGGMIGVINTTGLASYLVNKNENQFKESTAMKLYGKPFDDLDKKQASVVKANVDLGAFASSMQRLANREIRKGGIVTIVPPGIPAIRYQNGEVYTLKMSGKEEEWYMYGVDSAGNEDWFPTGIKIPEIEKTKGPISTAIEGIKSILTTPSEPKTDTPTSPIYEQYRGYTPKSEQQKLIDEALKRAGY